MKFPCTTPPEHSIPRLLPEIILPAAAVFPPMRVPAPVLLTPSCRFFESYSAGDIGANEVALHDVAWLTRNKTPSPMFPEIRLRAAGVMPPIVLLMPETTTARRAIRQRCCSSGIRADKVSFDYAVVSQTTMSMRITLKLVNHQAAHTTSIHMNPDTAAAAPANAPLSSINITALSP